MKEIVMQVLDSYIAHNICTSKDITLLLNGNLLACELFLKW